MAETLDVTMDRVITANPIRMERAVVDQYCADGRIIIGYVDGGGGIDRVDWVQGRRGRLRSQVVLGRLLAGIVKRELAELASTTRAAHGQRGVPEVYVAAGADEPRVKASLELLADPQGIWARHTWQVYKQRAGGEPIAVIDGGRVVLWKDGARLFQSWQHGSRTKSRSRRRRRDARATPGTASQSRP